jgi:hypothetical protein
MAHVLTPSATVSRGEPFSTDPLKSKASGAQEASPLRGTLGNGDHDASVELHLPIPAGRASFVAMSAGDRREVGLIPDT